MDELTLLPTKRSPGRPAGTVESLESLARDDAKENLKLSRKLRKIIESQIPTIEAAIKTLPTNTPVGIKERLEMLEFLADLQERLMKVVAPVAKVATSGTGKVGESDSSSSEDERMKAFLGELKGETT